MKHNKFLWLVLISTLLQAPIQSQNRILIQELDGVERANEPVTLGVPFSPDSLLDIDQLAIANNGTSVPAQFSTMSHWPDGSIKWVKVDFLANATALTTGADYTIELNATNPLPTTRLLVSENNSKIEVNTGRIYFTISMQGFNLFDELFIDLYQDQVNKSSSNTDKSFAMK